MPLRLKAASARLTKTRVKREGGDKGKIAAMFLGFDCIVRNIVIEPQEGNTVAVSFEIKSFPTKSLVGTFETDLLGESGRLEVDANILLDPSPKREEEEEEEDEPELPLEE